MKFRMLICLLTVVVSIGCESSPPLPTAPPAQPLEKDAKGKDLPKGVVAADSPF